LPPKKGLLSLNKAFGRHRAGREFGGHLVVLVEEPQAAKETGVQYLSDD
jgi:hypothetical protein